MLLLGKFINKLLTLAKFILQTDFIEPFQNPVIMLSVLWTTFKAQSYLV